MIDAHFWVNKKVFVTGHTGFKGSWLCLWLQKMGAQVHGYALRPPTSPSLFGVARVTEGMSSEVGDIRDFERLKASLAKFNPEIVIHMAAQPLVRYSYSNTIETYSTNVMGTVHLLEAIRQIEGVKAVVNVTSDKCYENKEWVWGYRENEAKGGYDPYSNSKGCAELVTDAFRQSFFNKNNHGAHGVGLASARAGNVIGGGDWAEDRLVPDALKAFEQNQSVNIRSPHAIRPWQHVLEPISGYLLLAQKLYENGPGFSEGWNFGPVDEDAKSVQWIINKMTSFWGESAAWHLDAGKHLHEAHYLKLDCSKAKMQLGWQARWGLDETLQKIIVWHKAWLAGNCMKNHTLNEISNYESSLKGL
jgi:CDP-glucose 4,6-dehydratase